MFDINKGMDAFTMHPSPSCLTYNSMKTTEKIFMVIRGHYMGIIREKEKASGFYI